MIGIFLVLVTGLLAGCAIAAPNGSAQATWVEPGWMAQVRAENEETETKWIDCLASFGIEGTPTVGVGWAVALGHEDDPPEVQALRATASRECREQLGFPQLQSLPVDSQAYERMLDTRECLIAQGFDIPTPPSESAWIDDGGFWNPFEIILDFHSQDFDRLNNICPQPGPIMVILMGSSNSQ